VASAMSCWEGNRRGNLILIVAKKVQLCMHLPADANHHEENYKGTLWFATWSILLPNALQDTQSSYNALSVIQQPVYLPPKVRGEVFAKNLKHTRY
jgi:hypothetical protein